MSLFDLVGPIGSIFANDTVDALANRDKNYDVSLADALPNVKNFDVSAPSSADQVSPYTEYTNSESYFDNYLSMLKKASDIGLFATAQDAANQSQIDRDFQSLEAQKEREWYEKLANSSYQRQVKDLEAAGLNPILGWANFGTGSASAHTAVPNGSASSIRAEAPNLSDYLSAGANVISSAGRLLSGVGNLLKLK